MSSISLDKQAGPSAAASAGAGPSFDVVCYLSRQQDLYHASKVYTGLCELESQGLARVDFVVPGGEQQSLADDALVLCLEVHLRQTGETCLLALDLHDRSDRFNTMLIERCDYYFKRSYYGPDLSSLPAQFQQKIHPFGLNYACRSWRSTSRVLRKIAPRLMAELLRAPHRLPERLRREKTGLYHYLVTADAKDFECGPQESLTPTILFQTRVYLPEEIYPDDPDEINEGRVAIVRALRKEFGESFRGGLVPTPYARERYPDAVSDQSSRQVNYIALGKQSLIGIYTRGLCHSLAFKLPEYLAAAKCIVSERLRNQLPVPLVEGEHYLSFATPEQCVEQCANLLQNSELAADMRQQAWKYYQAEVKPFSHLKNCLQRVEHLQRQRAERARIA